MILTGPHAFEPGGFSGVSQYATISDFYDLGLKADALEEVVDDVLNLHLITESSVVDSYLGSRYSLPLITPFPGALTRVVCDLAAYSILMRRGYNPETYDLNYEKRAMAALEWLKMISNGALSLPGVIDSTPGLNDGSPLVYSQPMRGWR